MRTLRPHSLYLSCNSLISNYSIRNITQKEWKTESKWALLCQRNERNNKSPNNWDSENQKDVTFMSKESFLRGTGKVGSELLIPISQATQNLSSDLWPGYYNLRVLSSRCFAISREEPFIKAASFFFFGKKSKLLLLVDTKKAKPCIKISAKTQL